MSQIQQYVKELNGLESRRGRKPLDINNVVYWFKNARAAQKRAELRGVGPGKFTQLPTIRSSDRGFI
jgi:homeobox domain-containing protein